MIRNQSSEAADRRRLSPAAGLAWRFAALAGLACGLAASPLVALDRGSKTMAVVGLASLALLAVVAPRSRESRRYTALSPAERLWVVCIACSAAACGIAFGAERIAVIDAGALDLRPGSEVIVRGFVAAVPSRSQGEVSVLIEGPEGRLIVRAPEPVVDLAVGARVRVEGTIRDPGDWERAWLERLGVADVLSSRTIEPLSGERDGIAGALDGVRSRAETALGRGTPAPSASLLKGFVLGQDDRIDAATVDDFKRSGLAHLLAVSGQNVVLLAALAWVVLAALDVPLRSRLLVILLAIAVYVPVAGAGASIQRAGVMGAAGIVAALAGRPRSRAYAVLLAVVVTLALDPRASSDIGWQLSFAAVLGIMLGCGPIARALAGGASGWRRALADAAALTIAATLATAPLLALHFGTVSLASLPANLVALPAVAPVMWLGMLSGALGQLAWFPVEPLSWAAGMLAAYIAQVADWFAGARWAQVEVELGGGLALAASYLVIAVVTALVLRWARRTRGLRGARLGSPRLRQALHRRPAVLAIALLAAAATAAVVAARPSGGADSFGLRVSVLDVGQGDSILLEPPDGAPVLIDAGPPDAEVATQLADRGVESLAALAVTHPDLDHDGGAVAVLERLEVGRLIGVKLDRPTLGAARANDVGVARVAAGDRLRSGSLRIEVLWPRPGSAAGPPPAETNLLSLVVLARWRGFEMLLTGDAEAELAPIEAGAVDVLKVAHHGSEDAGLVDLLADADPELAVISVGEDNSYGHPSASTLAALAAAGVPVLQTDSEGEIVIAAAEDGWTVR